MSHPGRHLAERSMKHLHKKIHDGDIWFTTAHLHMTAVSCHSVGQLCVQSEIGRLLSQQHKLLDNQPNAFTSVQQICHFGLNLTQCKKNTNNQIWGK